MLAPAKPRGALAPRHVRRQRECERAHVRMVWCYCDPSNGGPQPLAGSAAARVLGAAVAPEARHAARRRRPAPPRPAGRAPARLRLPAVRLPPQQAQPRGRCLRARSRSAREHPQHQPLEAAARVRRLRECRRVHVRRVGSSERSADARSGQPRGALAPRHVRRQRECGRAHVRRVGCSPERSADARSCQTTHLARMGLGLTDWSYQDP